MIKVSVVIPLRNDFAELLVTVANLTQGINPEDLEVIVCNDGSTFPSGKFCPLGDIFAYQNVVRINNHINSGVGYSFDRGVEMAQGEVIVLMGTDIRVREGWYDKVRNEVMRNPNTLGCAVSVGLNSERMDMDDPECSLRYGADLLVKMDEDDLPKNSALRHKRGGYTSLFKAKWLLGQQSKEPYKIPSLLGAFYFTSRDYYNKLHGWDTVAGNRFIGHRVWSHLEPHISLKAWLEGGGCTLYPDIEAGHIFGRILKKDRYKKGARSMEWDYWNQFFILETMVGDASLRKELRAHLHHELPLSMAQRMVRYNYPSLLKIRERNLTEFGRLIDNSWLDGNRLKIKNNGKNYYDHTSCHSLSF